MRVASFLSLEDGSSITTQTVVDESGMLEEVTPATEERPSSFPSSMVHLIPSSTRFAVAEMLVMPTVP